MLDLVCGQRSRGGRSSGIVLDFMELLGLSLAWFGCGFDLELVVAGSRERPFI